jgi:predicted nuclease of restriction endonuclease-like (RecB) superfamily
MGCDTAKEREFYLRFATESRCSPRELKQQMDSGLFERAMTTGIASESKEPIITRNEGLSSLRDRYVLEFLDLSQGKDQGNDLRKAIIGNLKQLILGLGNDFAFIDDDYCIQVGPAFLQ